MIPAEKIDLNEYEYAGEGANGASYNHKSNPSIMMKLYNAAAPYEIIVSELELAHKVYALGIPTPKPGDFVTDGQGRYGIRFERILDKVSFSRAVGNEPERVEEYAREFARMCKELHNTHLPADTFPNVKDVDLKLLEESPYFTPEEKSKVAAFIQNTPDADTAIHGDLQFSNAIIANGQKYFIDLGDFACGNPLFDLGMVLLCCCYDEEDFVREVFHMELATAKKFWVFFAKEYFGEDVDLAALDKMLRPYAGLKVLIIERNAGMHFPAFHKLLDDVTQN